MNIKTHHFLKRLHFAVTSTHIEITIPIILIFMFGDVATILALHSYCLTLCTLRMLYVFCTQIRGLIVRRFSCCTAVSSAVRVDCCHAMAGKRMREMRAVTSSHSEHALSVWGNGICLFCLPARLLCAVAKLDFQIKKPVGDQDSSFLLPFNNHPCLLFRESSLYIFFS